MTQSKIILFDIDRTIFDTTSLNENEINPEIVKRIPSITKERYLSIKQKYYLTLRPDKIDFSPESFVSFLCKETGFTDKRELLDVYFGKKNIYKNNLFKGVAGLLKKLKQRGYLLGIFSEGNVKYQTHKFISLGISDFFEKELIFIVPVKTNKKTLSLIPKNAVVVDDKLRVCRYLLKNNIKVIWFNKNHDRVPNKFNDLSVSSFQEILSKLVV